MDKLSSKNIERITSIRVRGKTISKSAQRREGDGFNARPKPRHKALKVVPTAAMSDARH